MVTLGLKVSGILQALDLFEGLKAGFGEDVAWVVAATADYSAYLEFGTSRHPPYPFLFPAAVDVMATEFPRIAQQAESANELIGGLARAIEAQAKRNATAEGGGRSTGTHPDHPQVQTGNLRGSIQAARIK